jgi:hypothetical protein
MGKANQEAKGKNKNVTAVGSMRNQVARSNVAVR